MASEISASFTLTGDALDPVEITAKVGIAPTKTWRKGDLIHPKGIVRRSTNGWLIQSERDQSADLEEHVQSVLEQLQPGLDQLVKISAEYDAELSCAVYVSEEIPAIHFSKEIVEQFSALNVAIDVDLYVLPIKLEQHNSSATDAAALASLQDELSDFAQELPSSTA